MKRKILALGAFSLCCLALFTSESNAFFGLLSPYHPSSLWHRHNRYVTHITCRPYNAFTPICWGNLVCDGCCPSPCGVASGCLPTSMGIPPWAYTYGMGHGMAPGYGGCCAGDACGASDMQPAPMIRSQPTFTPPMPMPMPSSPGTTMYQQPMPQGVSQANYYPQPMYVPQYYPGYYPMYNPYMQQAPSYWYGR
jgi:hypothetical protein